MWLYFDLLFQFIAFGSLAIGVAVHNERPAAYIAALSLLIDLLGSALTVVLSRRELAREPELVPASVKPMEPISLGAPKPQMPSPKKDAKDWFTGVEKRLSGTFTLSLTPAGKVRRGPPPPPPEAIERMLANAPPGAVLTDNQGNKHQRVATPVAELNAGGQPRALAPMVEREPQRPTEEILAPLSRGYFERPTVRETPSIGLRAMATPPGSESVPSQEPASPKAPGDGTVNLPPSSDPHQRPTSMGFTPPWKRGGKS